MKLADNSPLGQWLCREPDGLRFDLHSLLPMAYLTNTVYVQSLDDVEALDLHSRYTELLKAYEAVIQGATGRA